jgi:hypothetical protein
LYCHAAKAHQNAVADFVSPQACAKASTEEETARKDAIGIGSSFVGKAPGGREGRVNDEVGHLEPAVVDIIADGQAIRIGLDALLDFEDSRSSSLSFLTA